MAIEINHQTGSCEMWDDADPTRRKTVGPGATYDEMQAAIVEFDASAPVAKDPEQ